MSFVKLNGLYDNIPHAIIPRGQADSFAGKFGLGVKHSTIWTPEQEKQKLYKVIPQRYWDDFQVTRMTINSLLLPHVDNDFITTINFYYQPGDYRTMFYGVKQGRTSWKTEEDTHLLVNPEPLSEEGIDPEELKERMREFVDEKKNMEHAKDVVYVDAVYAFDDVYETGSFIAKANEAYMLDVRIPHTVEPTNGVQIRKAFALRTRKYDFATVYEMLQETGNL